MVGGGTARLLELAAVVARLQAVCPWTQAQSARDMLEFTRKELVEAEEIIDGQSGGGPEKLTAELGDILFDVLMLVHACERECGSAPVERVCDSAMAKLRRRAPYAFEGGPPVLSAADASRMWQAGKEQEQGEQGAPAEGARGSSPPADAADAPVGRGAAPGGSAAPEQLPAPPRSPAERLRAVEGLFNEEELDGLSEWKQDLERDLQALSDDDSGDEDSEDGEGQ